MQEFKYQTCFSSLVRVITPQAYCEQLSLASLKDLAKLFDANINIDENPDLLLNAFNSAVANRINANDDGVDSAGALAISKNFLHKPMDVEHDRSRVVGHIVSQAFSQFGSNEVIADVEALKGSNKPFNICLGAVVYKAFDPKFAQLLVESADETNPRYGAVSASWELGFNSYNLLLGHRDVAEGELITDPKQVQEFAKYLRVYGGTGYTPDKVPVYRLISDGLPMACGYTTSPAADVKGVIVADEFSQNDTEDDSEARETITISDNTVAAETTDLKNNEKSSQTISQNVVEPVKSNSNMEIKSISDITDVSLKEVSAASVIDFIKAEILKSNETYKAQVEAKEQQATEAANKSKELETKLNEALEASKANAEELKRLQEAQAAEKADREFNERMSDLTDKYDIDEKLSKIVASEIKGLDDAAYAKWFEKFEVLASSKAKKQKTVETAVASTTAETVLENAKVDENQTKVPATTSSAEQNTYEKYADAFSGEAVTITSRRR